MFKIFDFLSVDKEWSKTHFYILIYMFNKIELMMFIDRGLYKLRIDNNTNTAAPLFLCTQKVSTL